MTNEAFDALARAQRDPTAEQIYGAFRAAYEAGLREGHAAGVRFAGSRSAAIIADQLERRQEIEQARDRAIGHVKRLQAQRRDRAAALHAAATSTWTE